MKASDISDARFVAAVRESARDNARTWGRPYQEAEGAYAGSTWSTSFVVAEILDVPFKVAAAKFRRCAKRGLVDGCGCGCRGDWHIIDPAACDALEAPA